MKQRKDWSEYNDLESVQRFIDEKEIKTCSEFNKKFGGLRSRLSKIGFSLTDLHFPEERNNWDSYNTLENIQEFIDREGIKSNREFNRKYGGLAKKLRTLGISQKDLKFPTYNEKASPTKWEDYKELKDFQDLINKENIKSCSEFSEKYSSLTRKLYKLGISLTDLKFPTYRERTSPTKWEDYNNIEDFQKFIDENNIKSSKDFSKRYGGLYRRLSKLGLSLTDLHFPNPHKSTLEIDIENWLTEHSIKYERQKRFSDLGLLSFDFYLPDYGVLLEPGGDQHIIPVEIWGGEKSFKVTREHDIKKKEFCESNGYTILYYFKFYRKSVYKILEQDGFLGVTYYTDIDEYFNEILRLIEEKKK